ncbi:MAG: GntR family transcriptional regulator [Tissierellia bacterium]|nr:GntR family transcriptional regulator [Tissierellia bacterium]
MEYSNNKPIYLQIVDEFIIDIISSKIIQGERLASIRDVALEKKVNPNTVQRAFSEMERMGIIYTQRGVGSFIVEDKELLDSLKNNVIENDMDTFLKKMNSYGCSNEEVIELIKRRK